MVLGWECEVGDKERCGMIRTWAGRVKEKAGAVSMPNSILAFGKGHFRRCATKPEWKIFMERNTIVAGIIDAR